MTFEVIGLKSDLIEPNTDFIGALEKSLLKNKIQLKHHDILVVAESVLATMQGRLINLNSIKPSTKAIEIAKEYEMDSRYVEVILKKADKIYGGVKNVLLCKKEGNLLANAGIDQSNAPPNNIVLLPNLRSLDEIRREIEDHYKIRIGLIIADSRTQALRKGVVGLALATSGFEPVESFVGRKDLYGKELKFTHRALADDIACAAEIEMGESNESIPFVIVRGIDAKFTDNPESTLLMPEEECLYMNVFRKHIKDLKRN